MAQGLFDGPNYSGSFQDCEFKSGAECLAQLEYDEANFPSYNGSLQDASLPSAFENPLDCSDWSLRISHVSMSPSSSNASSGGRRHLSFTDYTSDRTHALGALDKNALQRPTFGLPVSSPPSDRTPVVYYKPSNSGSDSRRSDSPNSTIASFMTASSGRGGNSVFDKTLTPLPAQYRLTMSDSSKLSSEFNFSSSYMDFAPLSHAVGASGDGPGKNICRMSYSSDPAGTVGMQNNGSGDCSNVSRKLSEETGENHGTTRRPSQCSAVSASRGGSSSVENLRLQPQISTAEKPRVVRNLLASSGKENVAPGPSVNAVTDPSSRRTSRKLTEQFDRSSSGSRQDIVEKADQFSRSTRGSDSQWRSPSRPSVSTKSKSDRDSTSVWTVSPPSTADSASCVSDAAILTQRFSALPVASSDDSFESEHPAVHSPSSERLGNETGEPAKSARSSSTPVKDSPAATCVRFTRKTCSELENSSIPTRDPDTDDSTSKNCASSSRLSNGYSKSATKIQHTVEPEIDSKTSWTMTSYADLGPFGSPVTCDGVTSNRLSTGTLSDVSFSASEMQSESTVCLPLPSHLSEKMSTGKKRKSAVCTQTSALSSTCSDASSMDVICDKLPASPIITGHTLGNTASLNVIVPPELRIDGVCCVGLSSHGTLPVHNPTSRWLSVFLSLTNISVNGRLTDVSASPFAIRQKVTIDPNSMESIKVVFLPRVTGVFVGQLSLSSGPADQKLPIPGKLPVMVTLQAVAENPQVELVAGHKSDKLRFTSLPWGCETYERVTLINRGQSAIPVRLVVSSSVRGSFVFHKGTLPAVKSCPVGSEPGITSKLLMPIMYSCLLQSGDPDGHGYQLQIPLYFIAPRRSSSRCGGRMEEITGTIVAEVDVPTSGARALASLDIVGTVGTAKLHLPKIIPPIYYSSGEVQSLKIPLRNSGDILLVVGLHFSDWVELFSVYPSEVRIEPSRESLVTVTFRHCRDLKEAKFESYMVMHVKPDGPVYEVKISSEPSPSTGNTADKQLPSTATLPSELSTTLPCHDTDSLRPANHLLAGGDRFMNAKMNVLNDDCSCRNAAVRKPAGISYTSASTALAGLLPPTYGAALAKLKNGGTEVRAAAGEKLDGKNAGCRSSDTICGVPASPTVDSGELWAVKPPHIVLQMSSEDSVLRRIMVVSFANTELTCDVSWSTRFLSISPAQLVIPPKCSALVTVRPSEAVCRKELKLPWNGSVQVTCGRQTKCVNVEIRDEVCSVPVGSKSSPKLTNSCGNNRQPQLVSVKTASVPASSTLVDVRVPPVTETQVVNDVSKLSVRFPLCPIGDTPETFLEYSNVSEHDLEWHITSVAPPYIKRDGDTSCSRLSHNVYWWPRDSGVLPPAESDKVRVCFCPREAGHYSQCWQIRFTAQNSAVALTHTCQVEVFGLVSKESSSYLASGNSLLGTSKIPSLLPSAVGLASVDISSSLSSASQSTMSSNSPPVLDAARSYTLRSADCLVSVSPKKVVFSETSKHETQICRLELRNRDSKNIFTMEFSDTMLPFHVGYKSVVLRCRHFVRVPIEFTPTRVGQFRTDLVIRSDRGDKFTVELYGVCV